MNGETTSYYRYWGKADLKYPGEPKWHPLVYHCLDVAACALTLLENQNDWLNKLTYLSGLSEEQATKWVTYLLAIHDSGKFGAGFQSLRPDLKERLQGKATPVARGTRHDTVGYEIVMECLPAWLDRSDLKERGGSLMRPWVSAVTGHHGRPPRNDTSTAILMRDHFSSVVREDVRQYMVEIASLLLPNGCPLTQSGEGLAERFKHVSWLLAGLSVAADWLGSNTRWFPYHLPTMKLSDYWKDVALPGSGKAVLESGLTGARAATFEGVTTLFEQIKEPTHLQAWAETAHLADGPQLFILEELTGGGKTEAALTLAARLMEAGRGRGVYLALPTMATADAMFDRVRKNGRYKRFFAEGRASLSLAHSAERLKFVLEESNRRDSGYGKDETESASEHCTAWLSDNRKKALLADFGVGTIDQALLSILSAKHQALRLLGISTKVLLIDEVHACDAYMGELLEHLLAFHAALGGSAILLSATLPFNQRARYLSAFASGMEWNTPEPRNKDYPLVTHLHSNEPLMEQHVAAREESSRTVLVEPIADEDAVFSRIEDVLKKGRCVVWVRDTVADAIAAWKKWGESHPDDVAILFHARFALVDRLRIGKEVENDFGPESGPEMRRGRLVIATQVIEQSLDVDFDDMVTDLAPIDLVVQRAGRLQRHIRDAEGNLISEKKQKDQRGGACLAVLMPEPVVDAGGDWFSQLLPKAAKVYPDHGRLWLTARWLVKHKGFELPRQARDMVESVYGEEGQADVPDGLTNAVRNATGTRLANESIAAFNALSFDSGYEATGFHWQDDDNAPTRLGEKTVRVRLTRVTETGLQPWAETHTGMEWALSELTVPYRLIAGESPRWTSEITAAKMAMPDKGKYSVVVPLKDKSDGQWHGHAVNTRGEEIQVYYSPIAGLSIEKGVADESDI